MPRPIKVGKKERMTFAKINEVCEMPNLIQIQTDSYNWFIEEGLREVFEDISPIKDYADNLVLEFIDYSLTDAPKYEQEECKERDVTYAAPLKVKSKAHQQRDRRSQRTGSVHGRFSSDDREGNLHLQRRRESRGDTAGSFAGALLRRDL